MNTKEAIKWLDSIRPGKIQEYDTIEGLNIEYGKNIDKIQQLLRIGEINSKYKQVWEEIFQVYGNCPITFDDGLSRLLYKILEEIKQKYFPETLKKTVTIEIEAKDTEDLASSLHDIGNFVSSPGITKMKVINIGKMKKGVRNC